VKKLLKKLLKKSYDWLIISHFLVPSIRPKGRKFSALNNPVLEYPDKSTIVEEGQTDMAVFILLKGEAIVTRNDLPKVMINTLTLGALFGEVSFSPSSSFSCWRIKCVIRFIDFSMSDKSRSKYHSFSMASIVDSRIDSLM
jgi:CRP-like cAMP-binding protein